jgi:acyl-CoA synthetase (AMP-forming)/AMP-acid ligase II
MNVAEMILQAGEPATPAVLSRDGAMTHGELRESVVRFASALLDRGHEKGDRVGIIAENSPFFVIAYLAIIRAGLVAVPFETAISRGSFSEIAVSTGIRTLFVSDRCAKRVRPWAGAEGISVWAESDGFPAPGRPDATFPEIDARRDLASLMFTSGSTGCPKGVMVTHRNIECNTRDIIDYLGLSRSDRVMVVLPFHYCFGLSLLHTHLTAGGSLVLNNHFKLFPEAVLADMRRRECTGLAGVPSTYQILLRRSRFCSLSFPQLRWFQQAGGKLPNLCIREILESFPTTRFFLMYGQTEGTARLSYLSPDRLADKLGSVGHGLPSTHLEVIKADGTPVAPGSDELGEIVASGDNITLGYWTDPAETSKVFKNGRLHTGDLARVDADGFIFIVDRERDMIKSGGHRIGAKEVEDVIAELPGVVEVAVVGAPHDILGEAVKAFVVPTDDGDLTARHVQAHCRRRLPAFKAPEEVIFLRTMPHNGSGKILKPELKKMLLSGKTRTAFLQMVEGVPAIA